MNSKPEKRNRILTLQNILFFLVLFFLYALRTRSDLFTPYLWAEDGKVLIQRSIEFGPRALFMPGNGVYWFLQQLIGLISYYILWPFNNITFLPQLMSIMVKSSVALSVLYFTSEKFEWVMKGKAERFITCIFVILFMPHFAFDVIACDTSLPFALFFGAFLVGMDVLFSKKIKMPGLGQTIFFVALCLSSAAAVLIAIISGLAALGWLIKRVKEKNYQWKEFLIQGGKIFAIFGATLIQVGTIVSMGRNDQVASGLLPRIFMVAKDYPVFPYFNHILPESLWTFLIGITILLITAKWLSIPLKIVLYSIFFSYGMLLFSSFAVSIPDWTAMFNVSRHFFLSYQISIFLILLILVKMYQSHGRVLKYLSCVLALGLVILAATTYSVYVPGSERAYYYQKYSDLFDRAGESSLRMPTGPFDPWSLTIPVEIGEIYDTEDMKIEIQEIRRYRNAWFRGIELTLSAQDGERKEFKRILAYYDGVYYPRGNEANEFVITIGYGTPPNMQDEERDGGSEALREFLDREEGKGIEGLMIIGEDEDGTWYRANK